MTVRVSSLQLGDLLAEVVTRMAARDGELPQGVILTSDGDGDALLMWDAHPRADVVYLAQQMNGAWRTFPEYEHMLVPLCLSILREVGMSFTLTRGINPDETWSHYADVWDPFSSGPRVRAGAGHSEAFALLTALNDILTPEGARP